MIGLGLLFYIKSPNLADVWAARLAPRYQASYHKYWIDEFYGLALPGARWIWPAACLLDRSSRWRGQWPAWITTYQQITGDWTSIWLRVANAIGFFGRLMSPIVRAAQTGLTANYLCHGDYCCRRGLYFFKSFWC